MPIVWIGWISCTEVFKKFLPSAKPVGNLGTVLNDHIGQSHTAVDVAVKALNGEAIDNYYWVDYVMIK